MQSLKERQPDPLTIHLVFIRLLSPLSSFSTVEDCFVAVEMSCARCRPAFARQGREIEETSDEGQHPLQAQESRLERSVLSPNTEGLRRLCLWCWCCCYEQRRVNAARSGLGRGNVAALLLVSSVSPLFALETLDTLPAPLFVKEANFDWVDRRLGIGGCAPAVRANILHTRSQRLDFRSENGNHGLASLQTPRNVPKTILGPLR